MTDSVFQEKSFNFFAGVNFGEIGTKENVCYGGTWTVEYCDGFKESIKSYLPNTSWSFSTLSYGGSLSQKYSLLEIIMALGDNGTPIVNYFNKLTELFASELEFKVTLNLSMQYGSDINIVYYIDLGGV